MLNRRFKHPCSLLRFSFLTSYASFLSSHNKTSPQNSRAKWVSVNAGPGSIFFFRACCFRVRVTLGLGLVSRLTLTLKQHFMKKDRPRPRVLLTRGQNLCTWIGSSDRSVSCVLIPTSNQGSSSLFRMLWSLSLSSLSCFAFAFDYF